MKRFTAAVFAVPLAVSLWATPAAAAATNHVAVGGVCAEPTPTRDYDAKALTYRLAVDLSACDWWDGAPIQLVAEASRLDGTGEEGATSLVLCGGRPLGERAEPSETPDEAAGSPARGTCEVTVALDHLPVEAARYRGEIRYPWQGETHTVSFEALCVSAGLAADCHDLNGS